MSVKVCKFGGSSLADAAQIRKVRAIVQADADRRFIVPSAPGKRNDDDRKITDLLYLCEAEARQKVDITDVFNLIADRYRTIIAELGLSLDLSPALDEVRERLAAGASPEYAASRGEYLNGLILADALQCEFVDAAEVIHFDTYGKLDRPQTQSALQSRLATLDRAVIPGYYGSDPDGNVRTFSRGGSDISGALVASGVGATVYENWTDVSGLLMADPRIVANPRTIDTVTYRELRELAYMGASVLHDEAIFPVRQAGIPVNIRNTNRPDDPGTTIVKDVNDAASATSSATGLITGIAGRRDFTVIAVEKALMNAEMGFGRRLLSVLEENGINFEHMPSGIDTMSVVIADRQLDGKLDRVLEQIRVDCQPDTLDVYPEMALIATVGRGMAKHPGMAARIFAALAKTGVNIRMIDQGSSELNIIVGVEVNDFESAVRAIYTEFEH